MNRLNSRAIMSLAAIAVVGTSMAQTSAVTPPVPYAEWTTEKEIFVPMRDGMNLDTDVLLPKGAKGPLATVLVRTPYDKDNIDWAAGPGTNLGVWPSVCHNVGTS